MSEEETIQQPLTLPKSDKPQHVDKKITPDLIEAHPELKLKREKGKAYVFIGLPGSGKTTVAKTVAERFREGSEEVRQVHETDPIRHEITKGNQQYTEEESRLVYDELHRRIKEDLSDGFAVVSGTYWSEGNRERLEEEIGKDNIVWVEVVTTNEEVAKSRINKRKAEGTDASVVSPKPTDYDVRVRIHLEYEHLAENHLTIDNTGSLEELNASLDKVIA